MKNLPEFQKNALPQAKTLTSIIFQTENDDFLVDLKEYDDGHFRVTFRPEFFSRGASLEQPSKSQWNTLKKRLKRVNANVFVFKDHGSIESHYYIDFGFFKHPNLS